MALTLVVSTLALNAEGPDQKVKAKAQPKAPTLSQRLQQLQDRLNAQDDKIKQQQDQIQQLQQELQQQNAQTQRETQHLQASLQQAGQQAAAAQQSLTAVQVSANALQANVAALQTTTGTTSHDLLATQQAVKTLENPLAIKYRGLQLSPGGFVDMTFFSRSRNENTDGASIFSATPFGGLANSKLPDFRATARLSRLSAAAEGRMGDVRLSGYYELDFTVTSLGNYIGTNPWSPRMRQLWGQADLDSGWTVTAGQNWSLLTTNRKGLATRAEYIPNVTDGAYVVGFTYVRQADLRLTKNFNNKTWVGVEVGNGETVLSTAYTPPNTFGFATSSNALAPNAFDVTAGFPATCTAPAGLVCNPAPSALSPGLSTPMAPDLMAKVVYEPGWGHYEIKALGRFFRDRVGSGAAGVTNLTEGGGLGWAAILPVRHNVDYIFEGLAGAGIGRYGAANGPDVTLRPDGKIVPIKQLHLHSGLELHPAPKLDLFFYGGDEYYQRTPYTTVNSAGAILPAGYGSPLLNNSNCSVDFIPAGTCQAVNKNIWEATGGFFYRFYRGAFGTFQYGMQYQYLYRSTWSGIDTNTHLSAAPKGLDGVITGSFRFVLP
jgi:hypothetical protein